MDRIFAFCIIAEDIYTLETSSEVIEAQAALRDIGKRCTPIYLGGPSKTLGTVGLLYAEVVSITAGRDREAAVMAHDILGACDPELG